jgi:(R)-amidase
VFALMTNRCGRGDLQMSFPGQSALVDPSGEFLVVAGAVETQLLVQLDPSRVESSRRRYQYLHEARIALKLQPVASPPGTAALLIE